jgi:hypothetical protein
MISTPTASAITVIKTTTKATITVDIPADVQLSAEPMTGNYRIKCNVEGYEPTYSLDIKYSWGGGTINNQISEGCHQMYDITEVTDGAGYRYPQNG